MDTGVVVDYRYFDAATNVQLESNFIDTKEMEEQLDKLYFMEAFDFPDLGELRASLLGSKELPSEQVEKVISGLATLPEYSG